MIYSGGCHCGAISFTVDADFATAIECNCSMCAKRGGLLAFIPRASLVLQGSQTTMQTYRFNHHKLAHHFCSTCGIAPFSEGAGADGTKMAAVNLRCLPDLDLSRVTVKQVDGKSF
jgi:hypothetical protein